MHKFRELKVWQRAIEFVTEIYRIAAMTVGLSRSLDRNQQHLTNVIWLLTTDY